MTENGYHKAIVRNCYAAPLGLYGEYCGGIAGYNSDNSLIENSYTNNSSDYEICGENHGDIVNCSIFDGNLKLTEDVEVYGKEASELIEALNLWVNGFPDELYLSWILGNDDTNYGLPIFGNTLNVDEITDNEIVIYPNPAQNIVKLSAVSGQMSEVKIYNILGMLVEEIEITSEEMEINISDYNSGVYFVEVDGEIVKLIKN